MGKHLSEFELGRIVALRNQKKPVPYAEIARRINKPKTTIVQAFFRYRNRGNSKNNSGSGRPRKTTARTDRSLLHAIHNSRFQTSGEIAKATKVSVPNRTIRRRLNEAGF